MLSLALIFIVEIEHHGQLVLAQLHNNPAVGSVVRGQQGEGRHHWTHIVLFLTTHSQKNMSRNSFRSRGGGGRRVSLC